MSSFATSERFSTARVSTPGPGAYNADQNEINLRAKIKCLNQQNKSLTHKNVQLERNNHELKLKNHEIQKANENEVRANFILEGQFKRVNKDLMEKTDIVLKENANICNELEKKNSDLSTELAKNNSKLKAASEEIEDLKEALYESTDRTGSLQAEARDKQIKFDAELKATSEEIKGLKDTLSTSTDRIETLQAEARDNQSKFDAELKATSEEIKGLKDNLSTSTDRTETLQAEARDNQSKFDAELKAASEEVKGLKDTLSTSTDRIETLQAEARDNQSKFDAELASRSSKWHVQKIQLFEKNNMQKDTIQALRCENQELQDKLVKVEGINKLLLVQKEDYVSICSKNRLELAALQGDLKTSQTSARVLQEQFNESKLEIIFLEKEKAALVQEKDELLESCKENAVEYIELNGKILTLESEAKDNQIKFDAELKAASTEFQAEKNSLQLKITFLSNEKARMIDSVKELDIQNQELKEKLKYGEGLSEQLAAKKQEIVSICSTYKIQIDGLDGEIATLREELRESCNQQSVSQEKFEELKQDYADKIWLTKKKERELLTVTVERDDLYQEGFINFQANIELSARVKTLEVEAKQSEVELSEATEKVVSLEAQIEHTKSFNIQTQEKNEEVMSMYVVLSNKVSNLTKLNEELRQGSAATEKQLLDQIRSLESRNNYLGGHQNSQQKIRHLEDLKAKNTKLNRLVQQLQRKLEASRKSSMSIRKSSLPAKNKSTAIVF